MIQTLALNCSYATTTTHLSTDFLQLCLIQVIHCCATVQMDCGQVGSWHLHHHIGHKPPDAFGCETNGVPQQRSPSNSTQGRDCCANLFVESRTLGPPRLTQQPCRHFQYHPISSNIHEMMPHFLSFSFILILLYAVICKHSSIILIHISYHQCQSRHE